MKIYISVDIEGLAGIVHFNQEKEEKERFRKAMHNQLTWVIEGIRQSKSNHKITEITIADSHSAGMNLDYDYLSDLDDRISLISGYPRKDYMMPCLDETYDVVFLVGYHGKVGSLKANMDHTYALSAIHRLKINGIEMSETLINSAFASQFKVPVGLVIGDDGLKEDLEKDMPWVEYVLTKKSISRFAAKYLSKKEIRENTILKTVKVLDENLSSLPLYELDKPYNVEIEFNFGSQFDLAMLIPDMNVVDGRTIQFFMDDYKKLFNMIMLIVTTVRSAFK